MNIDAIEYNLIIKALTDNFFEINELINFYHVLLIETFFPGLLSFDLSIVYLDNQRVALTRFFYLSITILLYLAIVHLTSCPWLLGEIVS
ncbi:hypothetical protein MTCD1_01531 [Colwellia marinimaniae]|uniref:Uncharacterized protein n=1 Tax=Colwellia marinimaniae TaxID=1513592 RepID=A0ABQ0MU94_9GAMM|nr:hypothetical protein MTCD1_01531 [Colwellia marinimaniae]